MNPVLSECARRGVKEILHFTTDRGLLGIMKIAKILSRKRLPDEQWLEFILKLNVGTRLDTAWLDYVNLSIAAINARFFAICSRNWHAGDEGLWWCVLAFAPEILAHDDVWFTTTNNFYRSARRARGIEGFQSMYAPRVSGKYGATVSRTASMGGDRTTDPQAEVLYPGELPLDLLRAVYVLNQDHADYYETLCDDFGRPEMSGKAVVDPAVFGR